MWTQLHDQGRITEHPVFPGKQGPAARRMETDADVDEVIALLRLNYDRVKSYVGPGGRSGSVSASSAKLLDPRVGTGNDEEPLGVAEQRVWHAGYLDQVGSFQAAPCGRQIAPILE